MDSLVNETTFWSVHGWTIIQIALSIALGSIYSIWVIKIGIRRNLLERVNHTLKLIAWLNIILGVVFHALLSLTFGLSILFYKMVILSQFLQTEKE